MFHAITLPTALTAVQDGALLLTANRRLARELLRQYAALQQGRGLEVWERGRILPWRAWLHDCFRQQLEYGLTEQMLLSPEQSRLLWERVIADKVTGNEIAMLRPGAAARSAEEAWQLIHGWRIPRNRLAAWATPESEQFLHWADVYLQRCEQAGWLDQARLPDLLAERFQQWPEGVPQQLILAGFDEISPQQQHLLDSLQEAGCTIQIVQADDSNHSAVKIGLDDSAAELECAARWAAQQLQREPSARVGIIVPRLSEQIQQVVAAMDRVFYPAAIFPGEAVERRIYNVSMGYPLSSAPIVADALLLLELSRGELPTNAMGRLLRSPFLAGGAEEWGRRALLDATIRREVGEWSISIDTLLYRLRRAEEDDSVACPLLLHAVQNFLACTRELPRTLSPAEWAERFLSLLEAAGWPHTAHLDSEEYQQLQSWRELLARLSTLGRVQPSMDLNQALRSVRTLADETLFQPQTPEAPLQILGVMEAVGLEFDHLWIMGLSDEQWPQAAAPNPLLPVGLQRELNMPHASASRELEFSTLLAQRIFSAAPEVIASYPLRDEERDLRPSPLLRELPELALEQLELAALQDPYAIEFDAVELETLSDEQISPLEPGTHLQGGSGIFTDQAVCPFKAFANHRLDASTLEEPVSGLDHRSRGIVLHRVLELVWRELRDQATLQVTSQSRLQEIITTAIEQTMRRLQPRKPLTLTSEFVALERERLLLLVQSWLQLEAERAPFSVQELEERRQIEMGALKFSIKADRIDRLEDGSLLVIDYKSGKARGCKGWFDQRLDEPQLPLYASSCEGSVDAVYRAYLRADGCVLRGVSRRKGVMPGDEPFADWDELLQQWRTNLERLALEMQEGRADVDPLSCDYCHLTPLCRIHERDGER